MRMGRLLLLLVLSVSVTVQAVGLSGRGTAEAQEAEQERPVPPDTVRVKADSLTFDQQSMSGTAIGDVRILYEDAILEAEEVFLDLDDKTSYARRTGPAPSGERHPLLRGAAVSLGNADREPEAGRTPVRGDRVLHPCRPAGEDRSGYLHGRRRELHDLPLP